MPTIGEQPAGRRTIIARAVIAIVLGAVLSWQIGTSAFAALAARSTDPRLLAVMGTPAHPQAGSMLAERLLVEGERDGAAQLARSVVVADPTNDRAVRVLGLAIEQQGQRAQGAAIMRQAAALGWRDTPTQLWLLRDATLRDDYTTLIDRSDALARRNRSGELTQGIFLAAITEPHLRSALVASLARQPMWRGAFFANVRQRLPETSIASMEALFHDMKAGGQTIGAIEWLSYVDRLIKLGHYAHARDVWATAFGIRADRLAALPYDGNFALAASRPLDAPLSQFEWNLNPDLAGAVTFAGGAAGSAMSVPGDVAGGTMIVNQLVILAAGDHMLSARLGASANARSAEWTVTCLPSGQELPRRFSRGADDALSGMAFVVPAAGCGAQTIALMSREHADPDGAVIEGVRIR